MLTDQELEHVAKLARLELDHGQKTKLKHDLAAVLDYIAQLESVGTEGVQPLYQVTGLENQTRADERRGDFVMDEKLSSLLIGQAPAHQERLVKVKSVKHKPAPK